MFDKLFGARTRAGSFYALDSEEVLEHALTHSEEEPVVLFKHSVMCGVSRAARARLSKMDAPEDPPVFEVVVQSARALSQRIAAHFEIRHESPQAIVVYRRQPVYDASHGRIRPEEIRKVVQEARRAA